MICVRFVGLQSAKNITDQNSLPPPSVTRVTDFVGNLSKRSLLFDEVKVVLLNKRRSHHNKVTNDLANNALTCRDENDCLEYLHLSAISETRLLLLQQF